jgi:hypothetical protein
MYANLPKEKAGGVFNRQSSEGTCDVVKGEIHSQAICILWDRDDAPQSAFRWLSGDRVDERWEREEREDDEGDSGDGDLDRENDD